MNAIPARAAALVVLIPAFLAVAPAHGQRPPFTIAGQSIGAGTRLDLDLPVAAGASDPATRIPVTVFHGRTAGPVLALTVGVHGFEFPPILAGQRLLSRIDPATLSGTVILVRIAHLAAFEHRVPYVNPFDRQNLNRVFPGRVDGSQSERIAWVLTTEVMRRCDVHVELHGGDGAEWLEPFVGIYGGVRAAAQYDMSRRMGLAFGFPNVIKYSMDTAAQVDGGRSLNRQAVADGKPTILVEIGENGRRDDLYITAIVTGVENLLRTLRMVAGAPAAPRADTRWFNGTADPASTVSGIFSPVAARGRPVTSGELIGIVTDYAGRELQRITSPVDGYALYGLAGPPVRAGEAVITIGLPAPGPL